MTKEEICKRLDSIILYCTVLRNEIENIEPEIQDGSIEHPYDRIEILGDKPWKYRHFRL